LDNFWANVEDSRNLFQYVALDPFLCLELGNLLLCPSLAKLESERFLFNAQHFPKPFDISPFVYPFCFFHDLSCNATKVNLCCPFCLFLSWLYSKHIGLGIRIGSERGKITLKNKIKIKLFLTFAI